MIKISTSILNADDRKTSIIDLNSTNTDYIHIDVMDGDFVPNSQFTVNEINKLSPISKKPFDIHLMAYDPESYIDKLDLNNIKIITIHLEIDRNINHLIDKIKSHNIMVGLAIKPGTDINLLNPYLDKIDIVLVMSVEPGFGGQKFIENTIPRITSIRNKKSDVLIEVDGGINLETIDKIKYISDIAVVGSYITKSNNYNKAINNLKN